MATFDFDDLFTQYYTLYRAEATPPASTDDEYTIALAMAKEAINHWATYDGTYWKELFTTNQTDGTGDTTITTNDRTYSAPSTMQEYGGKIRVLDSDSKVVQEYPIIEPHEKQFKPDNATFAYFTGNPATGFTLNLNPAPPSSLSGKLLEYDFYKKPSYPTTGADTFDMSDPYFIVHRMLANRFRASRNPYYTSAKQDAENSLKKMKIDNDSGSWANPWQLADNSGAMFGV